MERLKREMRRYGVKQIVLAAEAGVTRMHVCHVLAGRTKSLRIVKLARAAVRAAKQQKAEQSQTPEEATR